MYIRPLRTEKDHKATLRRIAELMSAERGIAKGDELQCWRTPSNASTSRSHPPMQSTQFSFVWNSRDSNEKIWSRSSDHVTGSAKCSTESAGYRSR